MNERISEQVSAFLDGELPAAEQRLLLERLARDRALRAQWGRYQLIGDGLRKSLPARIDPGLADRVMAELETLPAHHGRSRAVTRLLKPVAGAAVAASVALAAVLVVQQTRTPEPGTPQVAVHPAPVQYARIQPPQEPPRALSAAQAQDRLNEYLVNHSKYAASGGMPGMLPYVRIVGHDQD